MKIDTFVDYESQQLGIKFTSENPDDPALLRQLEAVANVALDYEGFPKVCFLRVDIVPDDIEQHPEHRVIGGILQISPVARVTGSDGKQYPIDYPNIPG